MSPWQLCNKVFVLRIINTANGHGISCQLNWRNADDNFDLASKSWQQMMTHIVGKFITATGNWQLVVKFSFSASYGSSHLTKSFMRLCIEPSWAALANDALPWHRLSECPLCVYSIWVTLFEYTKCHAHICLLRVSSFASQTKCGSRPNQAQSNTVKISWLQASVFINGLRN